MIYKLQRLATVFCMTTFYRPGGAWPPCTTPPGFATGISKAIKLYTFSTSEFIKGSRGSVELRGVLNSSISKCKQSKKTLKNKKIKKIKKV